MSDGAVRPLVIWVDGSVEGNGGRGREGWGAVLVCGAIRREACGGLAADRVTNNHAELLAIRMGLEQVSLSKRGQYAAVVRSDSQWAVNVLTGAYRTGHHPELREAVLAAAAGFAAVRFEWVRGHNGTEENERAHELAAEGLQGAGRQRTLRARP